MMQLVLTLTVVLLAGCSAGADERLTKDEYQQRILDLAGGEDATEAIQLFTDSVAQDYGRAECAARLQQLHGRLESILEEVAEIHPPEDAEEAQREFLAAGRDSVDQVDEIADEVSSGQLRCGQALTKQLYGMSSTNRAREALARLENSGYFIFGD